MIFVSETGLRRAIQEFIGHYHRERNIGTREPAHYALIVPLPAIGGIGGHSAAEECRITIIGKRPDLTNPMRHS